MTSSGTRAAHSLVQQLRASFREQICRALETDLDAGPVALAFVDHYLRLGAREDREPILSLLAAGAGAYYGELIREAFGAEWIGDGQDPRRLRLLLQPQLIHFSPVDQALEALVGTTLAPEDPRHPPGHPLDAAFHVHPPAQAQPSPLVTRAREDAEWLQERLAERPPLPEDQYYTLTCRFETLQLMVELLAEKHAQEGHAPRQYGLEDYAAVLGASD